jgi:hypothetical protein
MVGAPVPAQLSDNRRGVAAAAGCHVFSLSIGAALSLCCRIHSKRSRQRFFPTKRQDRSLGSYRSGVVLRSHAGLLNHRSVSQAVLQ